MKTKLIVMLTHHDKTVTNALETFNQVKDLEVDCWGFKDVGIPRNEMEDLLKALKDAKKETFLEVVTYSESQCMAGAKLAVEMGFDYLMGTIFYPSVWEYLKDKNIKYFPFVGKVSGSPSILESTAEEIVQQGKELADMGVSGFDILAYRHTGDAEGIAREFVKEMKVPVVVAGSVNSRARMRFVEDIGAWGYTMGSALFEKDYVKDGTFRDNLKAVIDLMNSIN